MSAVQTAEAARQANTANYPHGVTDSAQRAAQLETYHAEQNRIEAQFKEDLIAEEATQDSAALNEAIYEKAYSDGHSSGYGEIHHHFVEYVDFADRIRGL